MSWMLNTLVKSASELQLRNSRLFSILDPQTYGYHPTAVGPQPVGSIKPIKVLPQAHSKRMEPNFQSSMVPGVLRLSSVKTLLSLPECKLRMFNSERPPLYQEYHSLRLNLTESSEWPSQAYLLPKWDQCSMTWWIKEWSKTLHSHSFSARLQEKKDPNLFWEESTQLIIALNSSITHWLPKTTGWSNWMQLLSEMPN